MSTQRKFNCKHEEVVVICDYVQSSFERDLSDFTAYSAKFNEYYLDNFKAKNEAMNQIMFPQEKTKELKIVTARLYANMDKLREPLDRIEGYITLAQNIGESDEGFQRCPLSANDFGVTVLKQKIRLRDAEGVLKGLQLIVSNLEQYGVSLTQQGLSPETINQFRNAFAEIDADNQKQYEIVSSRRLLTAENLNALNLLYEQMMEICKIGKILYKTVQKEKLPDYTIVYLTKKVRIS
jgi:hypothetical protein